MPLSHLTTTQTKGTVLIAGYSEGLGSALAEKFKSSGYDVVTMARHYPAQELVDLTDAQATAEVFARLDQHHSPIVGVVHNAMQFLRQPFLETTPEALESVWRSMVLTAFNITQQALPRMIAHGGGTLVYSGASGSVRAGPGFAAFSSAKFALRGLVQAISREHDKHGIHAVHVVIDGLIHSQKTAQRFGIDQAEGMIQPDELAEQYVALFKQPRSVWTQELDIRPQSLMDSK